MRRHRGSRRRFRSGLEDRVIEDLEKRGIEYEYEPRSFDYWQKARRAKCQACGGVEIFVKRRYTPDVLLKKSGIWVEIKGKLTPSYRGRIQALVSSSGMGGGDLRFLFQRDNWITKKHVTRYTEWAESLGLKSAVGESIPEEWLHEHNTKNS